MDDLIPCPYCGKIEGFYTKLYGTQYYDSRGEDAGYEIDKEGRLQDVIPVTIALILKK